MWHHTEEQQELHAMSPVLDSAELSATAVLVNNLEKPAAQRKKHVVFKWFVYLNVQILVFDKENAVHIKYTVSYIHS